MPFVNKDQIQRAKEINVLDYILRHESQNIRKVGECYRLIDHPSISISDNGWYWHSQSTGSKTALDYLVIVRGYSFIDAVNLLMNEKPWDHFVGQIEANTFKQVKRIETASEHRKPLILPKKNDTNTRVIAYLLSRGIDRSLITACIENNIIYESAKYSNCVFVGLDNDGVPRYATLRGIFSSYKCDVKGSDKRYGFFIQAENKNHNTVAVFEGAIDCLSHQTLCNQGFIDYFDGWRLSLGCTASSSLKGFLERTPTITRCLICTDNDAAGHMAAERLMDIKTISTERRLPQIGKDWNEYLLTLQKQKRLENHVIQKEERSN